MRILHCYFVKIELGEMQAKRQCERNWTTCWVWIKPTGNSILLAQPTEKNYIEGEGVRVLVKNCEQSEQMALPTVSKCRCTCFLEEISLLAPWCSVGMSQRELCA